MSKDTDVIEDVVAQVKAYLAKDRESRLFWEEKSQVLDKPSAASETKSIGTNLLERQKMEMHSKLAHVVLTHLDYLKPVMVLSIEIIAYADQQIKKLVKPVNYHLEYHDISMNELRFYFPHHLPTLGPLIKMLKYTHPKFGDRIMILDLLVMICILVSAPLIEKGRYLFEWFNSNKTGLLEEQEHTNLILRVVHCFKAVKLMGAIDITVEEAQHMALEARTKHENGEIRFVPGLYVFDFIKWIQKNNECKGIFRFIEVLHRLVDTFVTLTRRANALHTIMLEKAAYQKDHERHLDSICPSMRDLDVHDKRSSACVFPVFRSHNAASFCIYDLGKSTGDVFIKYDKIVKFAEPQYEIPKNITRRNKDAHETLVKALRNKCCDPYYTLTAYQRVPIPARNRDVGFHRVDLVRLEPASRYNITIYSNTHHYRTIEISTLPEPTGVSVVAKPLDKINSKSQSGGRCFCCHSGSHSTPVSGDNKHGSGPPQTVCSQCMSDTQKALQAGRLSVTILPSSLSYNCMYNLLYDKGKLQHSAATVFTGTICPTDDVLRDAYQALRNQTIVSPGEMRILADQLCNALNVAYARDFVDSVCDLLGFCFGADKTEYNPYLFSACTDKQVMYYNGAGPWGHCEALQQFRHALKFDKEEFHVVECELERLYGRYAQSVSPPVCEWCNGYTRLVFIRSRVTADSQHGVQNTLKNVDGGTLDADGLISYMNQKTQHDNMRLKHGEKSKCEHLVLLVRSPLDLLDGDYGLNKIIITEKVISKQNTCGLHINSVASKADFEQLLTAFLDESEAQDRKESAAAAAAAAGDTTSTKEMATDDDVALDNFSKSSKIVYRSADGEDLVILSEPGQAPVKLTGKHELIHGEHSSMRDIGPLQSQPSLTRLDSAPLLAPAGTTADLDELRAKEEAFDTTFYTLIQALMEWVRSDHVFASSSDSTQPAANLTRKITVVSTAWLSGVNFEIVYQNSEMQSPVKISVEHVSLLATKPNPPPPSVPEPTSAVKRGKTKTEAPPPQPVVDPKAPVVIPPTPETQAFVDRVLASLNDKPNTHNKEEPKTSAKQDDETSNESISVEEILSRLRTSLPKDMVLVELPATPLRAIRCDTDSESGEPIVEFYLITADKHGIEPAVDLSKPKHVPEPVFILQGPRILQLTSSTVRVSATARGDGAVKASLYELPCHMTYEDVCNVLYVDRSMLRFVESVEQPVTHTCIGNVAFSFTSLLAFCTYCIVLDPGPAFGEPFVAHFRTMPIKNCVHSVLLTSLCYDDYRVTTNKTRKIKRINGITRGPPCPIFALFDCKLPKQPNPFNIEPMGDDSQGECYNLRKQSYFVHTEPSTNFKLRKSQPNSYIDDSGNPVIDKTLGRKPTMFSNLEYKGVNIQINGHFAYMSPVTECVSCLVEMTKAIIRIEAISRHAPIHSLVLFVTRPLVRYTRVTKRPHARVCDGPIHRDAPVVVSLIEALLEWKARSESRDCKIISLDDVQTAKMFRFQYKESKRIFVPPPANAISQEIPAYLRTLLPTQAGPYLNYMMDTRDGTLSFQKEDGFSYYTDEEGYTHKYSTGKLYPLGTPSAALSRELAEKRVRPPPPMTAEEIAFEERKRNVSIQHIILPSRRVNGIEDEDDEEEEGEVEFYVPQWEVSEDALKTDAAGSLTRDNTTTEMTATVAAAVSTEDVTTPLTDPTNIVSPAHRNSMTSIASALDMSVSSDMTPSVAAGTSTIDGEGSATAAVETAAAAEPKHEQLKPSPLNPQVKDSRAADVVDADDEDRLWFNRGDFSISVQLDYERIERSAFTANQVIALPLKQQGDLVAIAHDGTAAEDSDRDIVYRLEFVLRNHEKASSRKPQIIPVDESTPAAIVVAEAVNHVNEATDNEASEAEAVTAFPPNDDTDNSAAVKEKLLVKHFDNKHALLIRPISSELDLFQLTLGPVIGVVTHSEATVLFEVNTSVKSLTCVLIPLSICDDDQPVEVTIHNVKAYSLLTFKFEKLYPNTLYSVSLPDAYGDDILGKFRTAAKFPSFVQFAVTGNRTLIDHRVVAALVDQLANQQTPQLLEFYLLNNFAYNNDSSVCTIEPENNTFAQLTKHIKRPGVSTNTVFHIGNQSILSHSIKDILAGLLRHAKRLQLPVKDANFVGTHYFSQFTEVVKDTFRVFWASPHVREVLSLCSNIPLYNSKYLMPLSVICDDAFVQSIVRTDEDADLVQIIRKVYDTHVVGYIAALYNFDAERMRNHFGTWRVNSLAVCSVDSTASRSRIKRTTTKDYSLGGTVDPPGADMQEVQNEDDGDNEDEEEENEKPTKNTPSGKDFFTSGSSTHVFTQGFIDRAQWKSIRTLTQDSTITQMVLMFEMPVIPLTSVSTSYTAPESLAKGEMFEWAPTTRDLEIFLGTLFDWLAMYLKGTAPCARAVLIVSACDTPYSTVIQDTRTGLKIHQLCVGSYFATDEAAKAAQIPPEDIIRSGKIGRCFRYAHHLGDQDYFPADPLRTEFNSTARQVAKEEEEHQEMQEVREGQGERDGGGGDALTVYTGARNKTSIGSPGFSLLKLWFDTWKPLGVWSRDLVPVEDCGGDLVVSAERRGEEGILTVGPILGALSVAEKTVDNMTTKQFMLPILLEVDRVCTIDISAKSLFDGHEVRLTVDRVAANRPVTVSFGPLHMDTRYEIQLSGLKHSSFNTFVVNTFYSETESNVIALNCQTLPDAQHASQFVIDIAKRCQVPFHGIAAVLHTNCQPDLQPLMHELKHDKQLVLACETARSKDTLTPEFRTVLCNIIELFREQYRNILSKPSYRELLRSAFNIFMENYTPIVQHDDVSEEDEEEETPEEVQDMRRLFALIIARLNQEYFERPVTPQENVYRALIHTSTKEKIIAIPPGTIKTFTVRPDPPPPVLEPPPEPPSQKPVVATPAVSKPAKDANRRATEASAASQSSAAAEEAEVEAVVARKPIDTAALAAAHVKVDYHTAIESDLTMRMKVLDEEKRISGGVVSGMTTLQWMLADCDPVLSVYEQWKHGLTPAPAKFVPWVSPNGKMSVEQLPAIHEDNEVLLSALMNAPPPVPYGMRMVVISDKVFNSEAADELLDTESEIGATFQAKFVSWITDQVCNNLCLVCPTNKYGSQYMSYQLGSNKEEEEGGLISGEIYMLDSVFRCNEFDRIEKQTERHERRKAKQKKINSSAAKSKRALQKKEEDERALAEQIRLESEAMLKNEIPDGYLIVEARTSNILSPINKAIDTFTVTKITVIGSLLGDLSERSLLYEDVMSGLPTHYDHLQLPEWFVKFSPGLDSLFVQDEVALFMRQNKHVRNVLNFIEAGEIATRVMLLYESSHLAELSRPPDLREIDMTVHGMAEMFTRDLMRVIWRDIVPDKMKYFMLPLCDGFVMSYCMSKALGVQPSLPTLLGNTNVVPNGAKVTDPPKELTSATAFAQAVQYAMVLSVAVKTGLEMSTSDEYSYIYDIPDTVTVSVNAVEHRMAFDKREAAKVEEKQSLIAAAEEAAMSQGLTYNSAETAKILKANPSLEPGVYVAEADAESDIEDMNNEELDLMLREQAMAEDESAIQQQLEASTATAADTVARNMAAAEANEAEEPTLVNADGEANDDALAELYAQRAEWLVETLAQTVDNVLEMELIEALERGIASMSEKFSTVGMTEDDRLEASRTHLVILLQERVRNKRQYGYRLAFMS